MRNYVNLVWDFTLIDNIRYNSEHFKTILIQQFIEMFLLYTYKIEKCSTRLSFFTFDKKMKLQESHINFVESLIDHYINGF